jgi:hypothetical protein
MSYPSDIFYYLFKGDWYDIFSRILDDVSPAGDRKFDIWEPIDRHKEYNVIIVYGTPLSFNFCVSNKIWKTHEKIFDAFYRKKEYEYNIHSSYNPRISEDQFSNQPPVAEQLVNGNKKRTALQYAFRMIFFALLNN